MAKHRYIELTNGYRTLVDAEDYDRLRKYRWSALVDKRGHACAVRVKKIDGKTRTTYLHRDILGLSVGDKRRGDHKNGDSLDNRRSNLRIATVSQNAANRVRLHVRNTSGYHGVSWSKRSNKWRAMIRVNGKDHRLGNFTDPAEAAEAYNTAARAFFGEFASKLNTEGGAA